MVPTGPWQYNFISEGGQPLYNDKITWSQSVHYLEVPLYWQWLVGFKFPRIALLYISISKAIPYYFESLADQFLILTTSKFEVV